MVRDCHTEQNEVSPYFILKQTFEILQLAYECQVFVRWDHAPTKIIKTLCLGISVVKIKN